MFNFMKKMASGKKAYITGLVMIVAGAGAWYDPGIAEMLSVNSPVDLMLEGFGLMFLRAGVAKIS